MMFWVCNVEGNISYAIRVDGICVEILVDFIIISCSCIIK